MPKFVHIQNFELIFDTLDHLNPAIFSLKQPGRLAGCYWEITPVCVLRAIYLNRYTIYAVTTKLQKICYAKIIQWRT